MPAEDWMSVSVLRDASALPPPVPAASLAPGRPAPEPEADDTADSAGQEGAGGVAQQREEPPEELVQLQWESDRMRAQAMRAGHGVNFGEWAAFADQMRD